MRHIRISYATISVLSLLLAAGAFAQLPPLDLPQASPAASVAQTIGLTEIALDYHRPGVKGRTIWGDLVPWGEVWRAGANENTTISFSSPVSVNGRDLPAGTYGLHMIPTRDDWTIIFSKQAHAWGSFSYDQAEDALRLTVKPEPASFHERLQYVFEEPTDDSVVAALYWEKLKVPFEITVDLPAVVTADLREQLRGLPRFSWQGWNQAANYVLNNGRDLDQALAWAERSIVLGRNFQNLRTKAAILEKKGDAKQAEALRAEAMAIATEADINQLGYNLLGAGKIDEAIATFKKNTKDHPQSWNVYDSLAEAYARKGDRKAAIENYSKAMNMTTSETQKERIAKQLEKLKSST